MNLKMSSTVPGVKKKKGHFLPILSLDCFTSLIIYVLCTLSQAQGVYCVRSVLILIPNLVSICPQPL